MSRRCLRNSCRTSSLHLGQLAAKHRGCERVGRREYDQIGLPTQAQIQIDVHRRRDSARRYFLRCRNASGCADIAVVIDHAHCPTGTCGAAAMLAYCPGSQNETPPSSAREVPGASSSNAAVAAKPIRPRFDSIRRIAGLHAAFARRAAIALVRRAAAKPSGYSGSRPQPARQIRDRAVTARGNSNAKSALPQRLLGTNCVSRTIICLRSIQG